MRSNFFFFACVWMMVMPLCVLAHGTDYRLIDKKTVVAEFFYSDKTPMQYAEILIFSPANDKIEFQNGRTDQNGRFAFLAETPGNWQVKVNDGMGHAVHATVAVKRPEPGPQAATEISGNEPKAVAQKSSTLFGDAPLAVKLFFGLSILLNFFLGLHLWKRKPCPQAH